MTITVNVSSSVAVDITADIVVIANGAEGCAPIAPLFEVQNIAGLDGDEKDLDFYWDFDDAYTFAAPVNTLTAHKSANIAYGKKATHTYRAAGTYNYSCFIYERSSGKSGTVSGSITVTDPSTIFPTTQTVFLSPSGDFTDAPSGAVQVTGGNITTAVSTYVYDAGEPIRIMLNRGESYTWSGNGQIGENQTVNTWHLVAGSGAGSKPSVTVAGGTSWNDKSASSGGSSKDWVFQDIVFSGPWTSATNSGSQFGFLGTFQSPPKMLLVDDCDMSGMDNFLNNSGNDPNDGHRYTVFNDTVLSDWSEYAVTDSDQFALWFSGCRVSALPTGQNDATNNGGAGIRCGGAFTNLGLHGCDMFTRLGWSSLQNINAVQSAVRAFTSGGTGGYCQITASSFEGSNQPISLIAEASTPAATGGYCHVGNNYFLGGYTTLAFITSQIPLTVRDNIMVQPDVDQVAGNIDFNTFISLPNDDQQSANLSQRIAVYNNTLINEQSGAAASIVSNGAAFSNVVEENNLNHQPNAGVNLAGGFSNGDRIITPRETGYSSSTVTHAGTGTPSTYGHIPVPNTPQGITGGLTSHREFDGSVRPTSADRGAVQVST